VPVFSVLSIVEPKGLEQGPISAETRTAANSYAPDYVTGPNSQVIDQSPAEVVAAWRGLSDSLKAKSPAALDPASRK
jgi:hypothetical protein